MSDKLSLEDFDMTTEEGRSSLHKYIEERMSKHLKDTLERGVPITYNDPSIEADEIIVEYPDKTKKLFKYINGEEKLIK